MIWATQTVCLLSACDEHVGYRVATFHYVKWSLHLTWNSSLVYDCVIGVNPMASGHVRYTKRSA